MRTDQLIDVLARGAGAAPRTLVPRRIGAALGVGVAGALIAAYGALGFIPRELFALPAPWFKLGYAVAMALAAGWLCVRLARPAARSDMPASAAAVVLLLAAMVGWLAWRATAPDARVSGLLGHSWALCPWFVLALSLPCLVALLWALQGLAPTRPRAAGFAAGLLAGAVGAGCYALACTEMAVSFVAAWYTLGMLMSGLLGALLGPRWLRW